MIWGRNVTFSIKLSYAFGGNPSSLENLTKIVATHEPDGAQLVLHFGQIAGTSINELMTITRPDGEVVDYEYDISGDLTGVDKRGNDPVLAGEKLPKSWPNNNPIPSGNVPERYSPEGAKPLQEACGPRAATTILRGYMSDGACFSNLGKTSEIFRA